MSCWSLYRTESEPRSPQSAGSVKEIDIQDIQKKIEENKNLDIVLINYVDLVVEHRKKAKL